MKFIGGGIWRNDASNLHRLPEVKGLNTLFARRQRRLSVAAYRRAEGHLATGNYSEAFVECLRASALSHPQAMELRYVILSQFESSVARDNALAKDVRRLLQSAERDRSPQELWMAAMCLAQGWGTEKNMKVAIDYFKRASRRKLAAAFLILGFCYQHGAPGYAKLSAKALRKYRKGACLGSVACLNNIGSMLRDGDGIERDEALAEAYFEESARLGYALARANVAKILLSRYLESSQKEQSERSDVVQQNKAAEKEKRTTAKLSARKTSLGRVGEGMEGREKSFRVLMQPDGKTPLTFSTAFASEAKKSFWLASQAANTGNAFGMAVLGECLYYGAGAPADDFEAAVWLYRAKGLSQMAGRNEWVKEVDALLRTIENKRTNVEEWKNQVLARIEADLIEEERERLAKASSLKNGKPDKKRVKLSLREKREAAEAPPHPQCHGGERRAGNCVRPRALSASSAPSASSPPSSSGLTPGTYVFLSHKSEQKPIVRRLAASLRSCGVRVWIDEEQIQPGRGEWDTQIAQGVVNAGAAIFCLSNAFFGSSPCVTELKMLRRRVDKGEIGEDAMIPAVVGEWDGQVPLRCLFALSGDTLQRSDLFSVSRKGREKEWEKEVRRLAERIKPMLKGFDEEDDAKEAEVETPTGGNKAAGRTEPPTEQRVMKMDDVLRWLAKDNSEAHEQLRQQWCGASEEEFRAALLKSLQSSSFTTEDDNDEDDEDEDDASSSESERESEPSSFTETVDELKRATNDQQSERRTLFLNSEQEELCVWDNAEEVTESEGQRPKEEMLLRLRALHKRYNDEISFMLEELTRA